VRHENGLERDCERYRVSLADILALIFAGMSSIGIVWLFLTAAQG
jgi:hypothetical protein